MGRYVLQGMWHIILVCILAFVFLRSPEQDSPWMIFWGILAVVVGGILWGIVGVILSRMQEKFIRQLPAGPVTIRRSSWHYRLNERIWNFWKTSSFRAPAGECEYAALTAHNLLYCIFVQPIFVLCILVLWFLLWIGTAKPKWDIPFYFASISPETHTGNVFHSGHQFVGPVVGAPLAVVLITLWLGVAQLLTTLWRIALVIAVIVLVMSAVLVIGTLLWKAFRPEGPVGSAVGGVGSFLIARLAGVCRTIRYTD